MAIKYRWQSAHDWLFQKSESWSREELFSALQALALQCDSDTIQDLFQTEMDQDGYFEEMAE